MRRRSWVPGSLVSIGKSTFRKANHGKAQGSVVRQSVQEYSIGIANLCGAQV